MDGESDDNERSSSSSEVSMISNSGGESDDEDFIVDNDELETSSSTDSEQDEEALALKNQELEGLLKEEEELKEVIKGLKNSLVQVNKELKRKIEEMGRLNKKILKLQGRGKVQPDELLKEELEESNEEGGTGGSVFENGKDALLVFSEEIWKMILGNVINSKDLWNCNKTCRLFRKIVSPCRVKWLFIQIFPHLYKHLTGSEIMECRSVCKGWNAGVDRFFETHQSLQPHDDKNSNPRDPPFVTPLREKNLGLSNVLFINSHFEEFMHLGSNAFNKHFNATRNPLIGRAVTIVIDKVEMGEMESEKREIRKWRRLNKFLDRYGEHLWYLTVFQCRPTPSPGTRQKVLKFFSIDLFKLVPNMRLLRIGGFIPESSCEDEDPIPDSIPLSPAPKLETLQIDSTYNHEAPTLILNSLLKQYHLQLRRLHVRADTWMHGVQLEWPNLVELHVEGLTTMEQYNNLEQMIIPQLKKLGLSLTGLHDWSFDKVLEIIDKLSCTSRLNTLRFAGGIKKEYVAKLKSNRYAPSTLKTLEMEHCGFLSSITCYTFVLRFPFLENLNIFWRRKYETQPRVPESRNDIQFRPEEDYDHHIYYSDLEDQKEDRHEREQEVVEVNKYVYEKDIYNSNIWELLPNLKVFTFQWDVYTREGYEQHRQSYLED